MTAAVALVEELWPSASLSRSTPSSELRQVVGADGDAVNADLGELSRMRTLRGHLGHHPELESGRCSRPASHQVDVRLQLAGGAHEGQHHVEVRVALVADPAIASSSSGKTSTSRM